MNRRLHFSIEWGSNVLDLVLWFNIDRDLESLLLTFLGYSWVILEVLGNVEVDGSGWLRKLGSHSCMVDHKLSATCRCTYLAVAPADVAHQ